jgi:hypothetical protein
MKYVSLQSLIEPYLNGSFDAMPLDLRERVSSAFFPMPHWDELRPSGRLSLSIQHDAQHDPSMDAENERLYSLYSQIGEIESEMKRWELMSPSTITEADIKAKTIASFKSQIAILNQQFNDSIPTETAARASANLLVGFTEMEGLSPTELTVTFVGDKEESGLGGSNLIVFSARGVTKRVALGAVGLSDGRHGSVNSQGVILLGLANKKKITSTNENMKKMSRLRAIFKQFLGITSDPFEPYKKGQGWVPLFNLWSFVESTVIF